VLPTLSLTLSAAAVGFVNMWANLAGGVGSPVVGAMRDAGLGDRACLLALAGRSRPAARSWPRCPSSGRCPRRGRLTGPGL